MNNVTECDSYNGYYKHGYCYHECPDKKFPKNGRCHDIRSTQYSQSDCEAIGGYYDQNYCYLQGCHYAMINEKCYKYKSVQYSSSTCINIGGYYTTKYDVYPSISYCYYTSFNCRYHKINGQCYSRSNNHSQTLCQTIPDSYFDFSNNTCYYYCTEMPQLRQCFAANDTSFTRETCAIIGGIYYQGICYYTTSYCPVYKASNGQCYSNRSVAFTCDTCSNIGGHYENVYCYYYQYNCRAYSINGQCYSSRYSTYSVSSCAGRGGTLVRGYCYYEVSNCGSRYRNCSCYRYESSSKTTGTCANIGGYYDFRLRRCFYNSSSCRYYSRNSQCYKYREANTSRSYCSALAGYRAYERDNFRRYSYVCYFNEVNCSNWINGKCYIRFSASYNKATCASIGGFYSQNDDGCYYNSSICSYWMDGQCYDKRYSGWTRSQCNQVNGHYYMYSYYARCYISNYYCPYVIMSRRKCLLYTSESFDCSSCRLLSGHFQSGNCYYSKNCSDPLFLASNGQCYGNQTTGKTAAECRSIPGNSFYDSRNAKCYFTANLCSSGRYVNCQCFIHSSTVYTNGSCSNFGGQYFDDTCYYNSSYCRYHPVNAQCYRRYTTYNSQQLCENIDGYSVSSPQLSHRTTTTTSPRPPWLYTFPTRPATTAILRRTTDYYTTTTTAWYVPYTTTQRSGSSSAVRCYYNSFYCSAFAVDGRYCYTNRSQSYSRPTCRNIGGMYAYQLSDGTYRTSSYSWRTRYCLYNAFSCVG